MAAAIRAYLLALAKRENGNPADDSVRGFDPLMIEAIAREEFDALSPTSPDAGPGSERYGGEHGPS